MKHNFESYCKDYENIENYEKAKADNFKGWECHHRLETHNSDGERRLVDITKKELIALNMYYRRPSSELIFLTRLEHSRLHNKGKPKTEAARKKLSEANKGKRLSEETRKKISEARKGHLVSEETRRRMAEVKNGKRLSEETKHKMSEAKKGKPSNTNGMHWFNNGKINTMAKECPDGFVPGILR